MLPVRKASSLTMKNNAGSGLSKCIHTHTHAQFVDWNLLTSRGKCSRVFV